jgi:hypothetical protein
LTHEIRRRRLDALEAASGMRQAASCEVVRILPFLEGAEEEEAVRCEGPLGFVSYRRPNESFYDFDARASNEVLACRPPLSALPPPILVYLPDLDKSVKSIAAA